MLLLVALLLPPATSVGAGEPELGSLMGVVTSTAGAAPIAGANVALASGEPFAIANVDGVFVLDGLPAGTVQVRFAAAGFCIATLSAEIMSNTQTTQNFALTPLATLEGKVSDARVPSNGISNARVTLTEADSDCGNIGVTAETDAGGAYRLAGLPPGRISLEVTAPDYVAQTVGLTIPSDRDVSQAIQQDVSLRPTTVGFGGIVLGEGQRPVPGARVSIVGTERSDETTSNAEGYFGSVSLPPGDYMITAQAEGYQPGAITASARSGEETSPRETRAGSSTEGGPGSAVCRAAGTAPRAR
jgi:hypothetical protein